MNSKYEWHNLKANPKDLPTDEGRKLACTETKSGRKNYVLAYYCFGLETWAAGMNSNVVAWKEIEPFEEDNESPNT